MVQIDRKRRHSAGRRALCLLAAMLLAGCSQPAGLQKALNDEADSLQEVQDATEKQITKEQEKETDTEQGEAEDKAIEQIIESDDSSQKDSKSKKESSKTDKKPSGKK